VLGNVYMIVCVLIGWVLFRSTGLGHAVEYLAAMTGLHSNPFFGFDTLRIGLEYWVTWVIGIIACVPIANMLMKNRFSNSIPVVLFRWAFAGFILLLSYAIMSGNEQNPFIYFAF